MAVVFALERLYDAVVARFALDSTPVVQVFGWRAPPLHMQPTSRIMWVPGDPRGAMGELAPAKYPGGTSQRPRSLQTLRERFYVEITGSAEATPEDERAQYHATRLIYDAWIRAVYKAAFGTFTIASTEWVIDRTQRRHGATIRVIGTIDAKIPDAPLTAAPPLSTDLDLAELDATEPVATSPDDGVNVLVDGAGAQIVDDADRLITV